MCGRYRLSRRKQLIEEYFETENEVDWEPRYRGCYETREARREQKICNLPETFRDCFKASGLWLADAPV
jgi:hypothetical protein